MFCWEFLKAWEDTRVFVACKSKSLAFPYIHKYSAYFREMSGSSPVSNILVKTRNSYLLQTRNLKL